LEQARECDQVAGALLSAIAGGYGARRQPTMELTARNWLLKAGIPQMLKRRYILATLAGTLAAAAVWCWPVQPLWQSGPNPETLVDFSPDGQLVVTCPPPYSQAPAVSRWDAATGKLLSRVEIPRARPGNPCLLWPSPDGRRAVLGESPKMDLLDPNFKGG